MAHSSSMGKYGILHIVNRKNNSPAYSYPVDSEYTTFGRDDECDIRLLYGWVSGLHCKLFFQNSKAFLTVYGLNGVIVDGCHIAQNPDADGESSETTIPIMNNSQIEIYRKRFVFEYPSKELRIKAMAEPATVKPKRTLRLSMIQSAQVFTPSKPSADTQTPKSHRRRRSETLAEQLQSPIKPFSPARPTPGANMGRETLSVADEERQVTLVGSRGAQSVVVLEEEKDLVVVEAVGDDSDDDEDLSDEEEIVKDKENENPFDLGRSTSQSSGQSSSAPAAARTLASSSSRRSYTSSHTPSRPALNRSAVSAPAPATAPAPTPQPPRTPARRARFSLHKAVLLRSAQRQLIERERMNQLQTREATIFDEEGDAEMSDVDMEDPELEPAEDVGDANVDVRLASNVDGLTVADPDAEEEDAVEDAVSPERLRAEREADGSFSDDSERSMSRASEQSVSEGDVSLAESEESDISELNANDPDEEEEEQVAPFGARIRNSLSSLGGFLPNLLRSPTKESVALSEEVEEEEDIVDHATAKGEATEGHRAVKTEVVEEEHDAHEEIHFPTDSEDEENEDDSASELDADDNDTHHEAEASEEMVATQLGDAVDTPEQDEPSGSDEEDVHTPTEAESAHVDIKEEQALYEAADKVSSTGYFDKDVKPGATPTQSRRLNAFMTPQAPRSNFPRLAAGRKSVAAGNPTGATGDMSWLPGRVPVSAQLVESDEEEEAVEDASEEEVVEEIEAAPPVVSKAVQELAFEEKAARRQSALAVLAAGPRQLPNRRQSVAAHLVKSEPLDPNERRMTLGAAAFETTAGTPQHASASAGSSNVAVIDDSSDEEAPPESTMDTLRKKIDHMRRQSMHRAARESPIGPLFGEAAWETSAKLEDAEELDQAKSEDAGDVKQALEEAEREFNEFDGDEAEVEVETDAEEDAEVEESVASEGELAPEASDAELEESEDAVSDHEEPLEGAPEAAPEETEPTVPIPTGPSTPALKGVRALFRAAEVKGLGTQTPAALDGMLDMFGPEFEPEAESEPAATPPAEVETKTTRLRTKSADPTRLKAPSASGMARAKTTQSNITKPSVSTSTKSTDIARTRSTDTARTKAADTKPVPSTSRIATRAQPTKLPSRVQTPVEDPEPSAPRATTRRTAATTVSVVLPRAASAAKEEAAPAASKMKAPAKRVTRTASAAGNTEESKPATRTASSTSTERKARAARTTTPVAPEEPKPAARATRTKAATTSTLPARRKAATSAPRVVTPVAGTDDEHDPMDVIALPESPTKRSTRAKAAVKVEPEDEDPAPATRSRTKSGESETAKGKRVPTKRVASKIVEENKENAAVDVPEAEADSKAKPSALPTKTTRRTAPAASKLPAPSKVVKTEPAASTTTTRALRTRARK
ncbi:hypothetical protein BDV93DRAFT_603806 [Ceratobasidium sp. AG-I]|nr:hypothetical protein BDV93DRAFT_603806 [Ceratobasidium sp. AG-I]